VVAQNLEAIRKRLGGRQVTILGVTKKQPLSRVQEAVGAGLIDLGNNYAQEGEELRSQIAGCQWHFIGHIQSRKVKYLVSYDWVHSLDRIEIVADLHARLESAGRTINGLIEVNLGDESSKSGIAPEAVDEFAAAMGPYPNVRCRGIMVLPPPLQPVESRRPFFARAREIVAAHKTSGWDTLSMGTSEDFDVAVSEGATIVRLGTVLFGAR
jgi:PLP dependent protein